MKPKKRQKLCCNCDGEIDLDVIVCPFCAADLREEKPEQQRTSPTSGNVRPLSGGQQMSESLYPPPYSSHEPSETAPPAEPAAPPSSAIEEEKPDRMIGSILLFSVGVQLFVLGLMLVLFSYHGSVVLKWDARLWFLYVFASIPLLILGYRSLSKL
ncbi:MAG: hypothetical protein HW387_1542 [Parachlamydiales bacterium]|nr:hypothetical protein [Parachlamydiales bacterium]